MATPYDSMTMKALLQSLPELQRKKRRAEQLRKTQEQFQAMDVPSAGGKYLPTTHGGLFETVQRYVPDYGGMGSQIAGALGDYMTGREAKTAEDEYGSEQSNAILGALQQYSTGGTPPKATMQAPGAASQGMADRAKGILGPSNPFEMPSASTQPFGGIGAGLGEAEADQMALEEHGPMPTQETLRAYMGMVGGPDIKEFLPKTPADLRTHSTHRLGNGNLGIITNDPDKPVIDTGVPFDYNVDVKLNELTGKYEIIGKSGVGRGVQSPTTLAGAQGPSTPSEPSQPSGGFGTVIQRLMPREGGFVADDAGKGPTNYGINQTANPEVDVASLTPETAAQIYKTKYWDAIGGDSLPPAIQEAAFDAAVNMGQDTAKELVAESGGDPLKFRQLREARYDQIFDPSRHTQADRQSWTRRNLETTGGGAATTAAAVSSGGAASPYAPGQAALTPQQKSDQAVREAAAKQANEAKLKRQEAAKTAMSKTELTSDPGAAAAKALLVHPGLAKITAGTLGSYADAIGRKDDQGGYSFFGLGALARPMLAQNDPEAADALALIDQIRGSAFATGFQALVGQGAGSISNQEGQGIARALSNLETARSTPALKAALQEYTRLTESIKARWEREAQGEETYAGPMAAPSGARPQYNLPPGFSIED